MRKNLGNSGILVCQHGARHRYAVPRMLEREGMLAALYTDSSAESPLGKLSGIMGKRAPERMKRLSRRRVAGVSPAKVFSSDACLWHEGLQWLFGAQKTGIKLYQQRHRVLSKKMCSWGVRGSSGIYSMYHEGLDFIRWAKGQGLFSAVDVFISPLTNRIMAEEYALFPEWGEAPDPAATRLEDELWHETAMLADLLLCPSEWVAEGVRTLSPAATDKIRIVPYGCSIDYQGRTNRPVSGRVLFAGSDALRKGLHYLAQAAALLKHDFPNLDVRVAGDLPDCVTNHSLCRNIRFLGKLTSGQMQDEYLSADCFVLPSLSEGFAGVVAEAIGAGCPVVLTKEAGSPVVDGREGIVVPARNSEKLAEGIRRLLVDRDFRASCSARCLETKDFYSESAWSRRLIEALECIR
jgi:glycosyltransferase involved in cell wall biosynthesis